MGGAVGTVGVIGTVGAVGMSGTVGMNGMLGVAEEATHRRDCVHHVVVENLRNNFRHVGLVALG